MSCCVLARKRLLRFPWSESEEVNGLKHALTEFRTAYLNSAQDPKDLHLDDGSVPLMEPTVFIAPDIVRVMMDAVI